MVQHTVLCDVSRRLLVCAVALALSAASGCGAGSQPSGPETTTQSRPKQRPKKRAENLPVTPGTGLALLKTHQASCMENAVGNCGAIAGPLPGSIFYARYERVYWSLATFVHGQRGT